FNYPVGICLDLSGNLLVADELNHVIRKVTTDGVVTTLAGSLGTAGDSGGIGSAAQFSFPEAVAVDGAGAIYVLDSTRITKGVPILVPEPRLKGLSINSGTLTAEISGLVA